ncbi:Hypothetical predicted protein [Paramuricea clavata]|uniref:Uncharacterized protein n=1 Tax=Paramuricea clavata TaxID=317549 RepID=A0A6S7HTZ7_PARCT|nr:Hypothetical predicted protein [Paramuricea clavata]
MSSDDEVASVSNEDISIEEESQSQSCTETGSSPSTVPWWLKEKQNIKSSSSDSKKSGNDKQLLCKECLLNNRKYYTISNGMPSDIERHRKSKQHLEVTITTVLKASNEGHDLLARRELKRKPKKRPSTNLRTGGSSPKRARVDSVVKNVGKSQHPQEPQGILMVTENSLGSSHTQEGNTLDSYHDPINKVEETVTTELELESEVEPNSKSQSNINDFLNPHVDAVKECNATEVEGSVHLSNRSNRMDTVPELPSATDIATEVVKLMKEMKVDDTFEEKPKELLNKQQIANDLDEWRKIRNITELATQVPCLEFFYDEVMSESVIRCEVCFQASIGKENIKNMSPYEIARKKNPFNHGDPVTGIWNGKERTEQYLKGGNSSWRLLKSVFRSHMLGISTTSHGKHHYLAMKELEREKECKRKALEAMKNLVKCMVTDVKLKAASTQYETLVAFLDDCGVVIGQRQHSRKQMLAMLVAAEDFVDEKTTNVLKTELLCTQVYPHFFGVLDKGTVNRRTSQASYIVFMYNGKGRAYPVGAPLVYTRNNDEGEESSDSEDENESEEEEEEFPNVSGGNAPELASNFLNTIKLKLKLNEEDLTRYCGTSADGPYQAYEFGFTIQEETGRHRIPEELRFCQAVIWDATHLLNLAATDIKEGKFGES